MKEEKFSLNDYLRRNFYYISLLFILGLILVGCILTFTLRSRLADNKENQALYKALENNKKNILVNMNNIDMSVRGYLLTRQDVFKATITKIEKEQIAQFYALDTLFPKVDFDKRKMLDLKTDINDYYRLMKDVVQMDEDGNREKAIDILKEDRGTDVWRKYVAFSKEFDPYLNMLSNESNESYENILSFTIWYQILIALFGIPTLAFVVLRMRVNERKRKRLFLELHSQNNALIFDDNSKREVNNALEVVSIIINNLKKATHFIQQITQSNYNINWDGLDEENEALNQNNLSGELTKMRDQMFKVKQEEDRRRWENEGLNTLTGIIRLNQDNFDLLTDQIISFLVNYMNARMGGLYIVKENQQQESHLNLEGCYAYKRKKHIQESIAIGEGLIGQVFLEQKTIHLRNLPDGYTHITSGLGDATPNTLVVFPLKFNETVEGVVELASFEKYEEYQIKFLGHASEIIASALINIQTNVKTKKLLELSQLQAEDMKNKEEEMRQNMEELEATQEEMQRKEQQMQRILTDNNIDLASMEE